jgi:hypothetical protein
MLMGWSPRLAPAPVPTAISATPAHIDLCAPAKGYFSFLALLMRPKPTHVLPCEGKRETHTSKTWVIASYLAIFVVIATVLGAIDHASVTDPSGVDTASVAVRGVVIPPSAIEPPTS